MTIYLTIAAITALFAGYESGRDLTLARITNPGQYIQLNFVNILCQCLVWPAYYSVKVGAALTEKKHVR